MNLDAADSTWLVLTSVATLLACGGLVLLSMQVWLLLRVGSRREQAMDALQRSLAELRRTMGENGRIQLEIEHQMKRLGMRQDQIELREPQSRPYRHAIMLVKRGATVADLMAACGLSQGEAELIVNIHASKVSMASERSEPRRSQRT